ARPEIIIHQLTDLPDVFDTPRAGEILAANARLRVDGTHNLLAAAPAAGVRRIVTQSIAFVYAPGTPPYGENDPLATGTTADAVAMMERATLGVRGATGLVLRYGRFYGPGTWAKAPDGPGYLLVDAAA